ncbi:MAG: GIY-YIG nuclease family protein [Candidatus Omnitrophota bacterium]
MRTQIMERSDISCMSEFDPHTNYFNEQDTKMFHVYLLKSTRDSNLYIGFTNDLNRRVKEHNNGQVASTEKRGPFELIYCESYKSESNARNRERNLKLRSRAFAQLKRRISNCLS